MISNLNSLIDYLLCLVDKKNEKKKTDDNELDTDDTPQIKARQKQFLEERFSIIKPKTEVVAPAGVAKESDFTESSPLKENFRQELVKQYRKCQTRKIEDDYHLKENTKDNSHAKKQKNDLEDE